jgi:hypothetical protein
MEIDDFKNYEKKELIEKELKLCCIDSLKRVKISNITFHLYNYFVKINFEIKAKY